MLISLILIGLGLVLLMKGADFLVDGSSKIAKKFHIPEIIIGLTIVAIGTSLPELVISLESAIKGSSDISMGNIVGSSFANLFFIISLCAIIKPIKIKKETKYIELPFVIICTGILYLIVNNDGIISKYEGIALLLIMLLYILYNIVMSKMGNKLNGDKEEMEVPKTKAEERKNKLWYSILQILLGIVALKFGGDFVVDNAVIIAENLGVSEKLIGLTIIAFGTSLPELITCISATKKGESDLAIGNIVGSQIFNILLILGFSAAICPILGVRGYVDEILTLLIGTIIFAILPFIGKESKIGRASGISFVCFYIIYIITVVFENLQR